MVSGPEGIDADLVPLLLEPDVGRAGTLIGHVARANPLASRGGQPVLVHFRGPDAYITPGWYPEKALHGRVVPTWNYVVAEARGVLRCIEERDRVLDVVRRMTDHFERDRMRPWRIEDAPPEFLEGLLRAIVVVEIELESLRAKVKASQNRAAETVAAVTAGLAERAHGRDLEMAAWMERRGER